MNIVHHNVGFCILCNRETEFAAYGPWLRDQYVCLGCGTLPRQRAIVEVMTMVRPEWRTLAIHESSPSLAYFADQCPGYTSSQFLGNEGLGTSNNGVRNESLESLTFADCSFDIVITQDVLEHVFRPDLAMNEIMRVLRPGGITVFTCPVHKTLPHTIQRARISGGEIEYLLPAEYHGNPVGDGKALVVWDYGGDFDDLAQGWANYTMSNFVLRNRARGLDGEFLNVFVIEKSEVNRLHPYSSVP